MLVIIILCAIISLISGYYFVKNFNRIDVKFFGSDTPEYRPFGLAFVIAGAIIGSVAACYSLYMNMKNNRVDTDVINQLIISCFIILTGFCAFISFLRMSSWKNRIIKWIFLSFSCVIGGITGALGSIAIAVCVVLLIVGSVLGGFGSSGSKKKYVLDNGDVVEKSGSGLFKVQYYKGEKEYERTSGGFREMN